MTKILHSADIQVKNREINLYSGYRKSLIEIESATKATKAEILILSGDLFEYAIPNESERRLIYNWLSKLLNIKTLKEIVLIPGNHDLEKENKRINDLIHIESNSLSVYSDLLKNLDEEKSQKLIYSSISTIIQSKVNPTIFYIIYSLEDNYNFDIDIKQTVIDYPNNQYICIYHDMLKEYVDFDKLPIRKDIYNKLDTLDIFPNNTLICAGDIHKNLTFKDENKIFIYPGSPCEHTHSEGSYIYVSDKVKFQLSEDKVLKQYNFLGVHNNIENRFDFEDIKIPSAICYNTIELDHKIPFDIIKYNLENNIKLKFGTIQTRIKVKTSNLFVKNEKIIEDILQKISEQNKSVKIFFEYFKLVSTDSFQDNPVIQQIIDEKMIENKDNNISEHDGILSPENIDNLLLNQEQLGKMFESILDSNIKLTENEIDSDIVIDDVKKDILELFNFELNNVKDFGAKRYDIRLKHIETNGFMAIGANSIDLDIPGIVRILGTNGIGKTTLYNMIRWFITGKIYDNLPDNQVIKNTLPIFNKKLTDIDDVFVTLSFEINQYTIIGTRKATRKWKNNVSDLQKNKLNWKDYISSVDRHFELKIHSLDEKGQTVIKNLQGEQAEKSILIWFGDTVKNILFLNQNKIETILKTPSNILNELILNFIGVDYLKKLEDNLDLLKSEYTLAKPKRNKEDIKMNIIDNKIYIKESENASIKYSEQYNEQKSILDENINQIQNKNDELINIGNLDVLISNKKSEIQSNQTLIDNFEEKFPKEKIPFTMVKPVLNQETIDILNKDISNIKNNINNLENTKTELLEKNNSFNVDNDIDSLLEKIIKSTDNFTLNIKNDISILDERKNQIFNTLYKAINNSLQDFIGKNNELSLTKNNKKTEINSYQKIIDSNINEITSGICDKCGKPLSDNPEEHEKLKLELTEINTHTQKKIDICNEEIKDFDKKILSNYEEIKKLKLKLTQIDNKKIPDELPNLIDDVKKIDLEIIEKTNLIETKNNDKVKWQSLEKIQFGDYSITEKFSEDVLTKLKITEKIDSHKKISSDIDNINKSIEHHNQCLKANESKLNIELTEYTQQLSEYQTFFDENQYLNSEIDKHNSSIQEHNNKKIEYQKELNRLTLELIEFERKLPEFNKLIQEKTELLNKNIEISEKLESIQNEKQTAEIAKKSWEKELINTEEELTNYLEYIKKNLIWKVYSKLIKSNFKEIVFNYYRTFLNNTLNYLLQDVNFKLFWNNDSDLYMTDFKDGKMSYQPVGYTSGMEICFLGLSLIYTIHLLNIKNSISHLFIDEISGTLNDGKNLSYEASNYQELFVKILSKFKNKSIFIVDHNIDNLFETVIYEVIGDKKGSKYVIK